MGGVRKTREQRGDSPQHIETDGGAVGWIAVLGTFATWFAWIGIVKGLAVMLPTLQHQFDTHTWLIGWIIVILDGVVDLAGPFASPIKSNFEVRTVVTVSGAMVGVSFIASSFISNLALLTVILAGVAAPAVGIANILTRELIGQCFTRSYTTAFGIAASGASVGFVVFAPLTQLFLEVYGWRGAMMLLGAILMHLAVCGALLKPVPSLVQDGGGGYRPLPLDVSEKNTLVQDGGGGYRPLPLDVSEKNTSESWLCAKCQPKCGAITDSLNLDLFKLPGYWLIVFIAACTTTTGTAWIVYFAPNTNQSKGFSLADAANFAAVYGVGKIAGNLVAGLFDKCDVIGSNAWMAGSIIGSSVCFLIDPWMTAYWPLMVYAFTYGCFHSFVYTLLDVITKDAVGVIRLGSAFGWIGLKAGICRGLLAFFPGLVYDTHGSYTLAFILMGGINALALPALLLLAWVQRRQVST